LAGGEKAPPLAPGDAVTVSFLQGDVEIYTFGTVTYSDQDGRFLMFGHPMMMQGDANFPIGKGYVTWTFGSIIRAFKDGVRLSNLGNLGTLTKDRGAACGGSFKQEPDLIPVRVKIKDADTGVSQTSRFKVIRHPDFTPILIAIGMTSVAWEVLDRQPTGTMEMSYHIKGEGLEEPLTRGNYYTDDFNVISNGAYDLLPISSLLETNIYREVKVTEISIMVEITRNRINASIDDAEIIWEPEEDEEDDEAGGSTEEDEDGEDEGSEEEDSNDHASAAGSRSASPLQDEEPSPEEDGPMMGPFGMYGMGGGFGEDMPTFAPGETIRVKVQLQPYRTDAVWREFSIEVPEDFPSGSTMIKVHGGGDLISFSELGGKGRNLFGMGPYIDAEEHDLDSILEQIIEWPLNNELLVTLIRPYDPSASTELGKEKDEEQPDNKVDAPYQMEWVIYNGFMLPVNILSLEDEAKMKEMQEMAEGGGEGEDAGDEDGEYETNLPFMVTLPSLAPRGLGL
ncbi:hypothetical protein IIA79_06350, partial [bacterium]|nr:hypothetical protein [bacterium]